MSQKSQSEKHITQLDLIGYKDGDLSDEAKAEIEDHLVECEICQRRLHSLRELTVALHNFLIGADMNKRRKEVEDIMDEKSQDEREHIPQFKLIQYHWGDLSDEARAEVDEELMECEECRSRLDSLVEFDISLQSFLTGEDIHRKIEELFAQIQEDDQLIKAATEIMRRQSKQGRENSGDKERS